MKLYKSFLLAISLTALIGCGGGGGSKSTGTSTPTGGDTPTAENLSKTTLIYSNSPTLNEELTLRIEDNVSDAPSNYSWEITNQPASSNLQLNISPDKKSSSLTPSVAGQYKITMTPSTGDSIDTQFLIVKQFSFDETKLRHFDSTKELSKQMGTISNQVWVHSKTLTQNGIQEIVSNYQGFTTVGFDENQGLLVEFDETNSQSQSDINSLKTENGIDFVYLRVFEGKDFVHLFDKEADDGSAYDDGGDNWHLEHIGIQQAWDITTGSSDFFIGITDSGFWSLHEDLLGRFREVSDVSFDKEHGTAIAGAIGAISNNEIGMSGINWSNQLIGASAGFLNLVNLMARDEVLLTNNAWSLSPIFEDFDPDDTDNVELVNATSLELTRKYRSHFINKPNKLYIHSAGNGIGGGTGNSDGVYGVDGRHGSPAVHYDDIEGNVVLSKIPNAIFVAGHLKDNRLRTTSNYGQSVDIAAPTHYKSTKKFIAPVSDFNPFDRDGYYTSDMYGINDPRLDDGERRSFRGTSAASAVVTGVASLIYSVDKSFTGPEVKSILIKSATETVTERYINKGIDSSIETLAHPIPILNAATAVKMAKDIFDAKEITINHRFSNPFVSSVNVNVSAADESTVIQSFDYKVNVRNNGTLEELFDGTVAGFSPLVFQNLDPDKTNYVITGTTKSPAHQPTGISLNSNFSYEFLVPKVNVLTSNKSTQASIPNVSIEIRAEDGSFPKKLGSTDAGGSSRLYLAPGKFTIVAKAEGYKDLTKGFTLKDTDIELDVILELDPNATNPSPPTGSIERITPITPLTSSESVTNTSGPFTTIYESGFEGDIEAISRPAESGPFAFYDQRIQFKAGITSMTITQIKREAGVDVTCASGDNSYSTKIADFSSGLVLDAGMKDGEFLSCSSTYASAVPVTISDDEVELESFISDWANDRPQGNAITTNCPVVENVIGSEERCTINLLTNYLITDNTGKQHKVSTRIIYDTL